MGLRIQNNIEAFNTHRQLTAHGDAASKSMEKLSQRLPHQPRGRRRRRPGHLGEDARPDRRPGSGAAQRAGRHLAGPDRRKAPWPRSTAMLQRVRDLKVQYANGTLDPPTTRTPIARRGRSRSAKEVNEHRQRHEVQRHNAADRLSTLHVPGRRQRQRDHLDGGHAARGRHAGTRVACPSSTSPSHGGAGQRRALGAAAGDARRRSRTSTTTIKNVSNGARRRSARCRTASSTASTNLATYQENLTASESPRSATWTWPRR